MHISALHDAKARTLMEESGSETGREPKEKTGFQLCTANHLSDVGDKTHGVHRGLSITALSTGSQKVNHLKSRISPGIFQCKGGQPMSIIRNAKHASGEHLAEALVKCPKNKGWSWLNTASRPLEHYGCSPVVLGNQNNEGNPSVRGIPDRMSTIRKGVER